MREIEFQAYVNKKYLIDVTDISFKDGKPIAVHGEIAPDTEGHWFEEFELMQYTGLKDKNGEKIYEGDIIINKDKRHSGYGVAQTVLITPYGTQTDRTDSMGEWAWKWYEVIGNIYQNPDLLNK